MRIRQRTPQFRTACVGNGVDGPTFSILEYSYACASKLACPSPYVTKALVVLLYIGLVNTGFLKG